MIFTRSLLSLLVSAVICYGIPLRDSHVQRHRTRESNKRVLRQAEGFEIINSRTLNDGTRHETLREHGDELPSLPVPMDYDLSSVEGNDDSILVPLSKNGEVDQGFLKRIQPKLVFMTKEDIERLNGSLPRSNLPPLNPSPHSSVMQSSAKNTGEALDYEDADVPHLPKTPDYLSSKETDPDSEKNQDYYENDLKAKATSAKSNVDELKKELQEEIEEDRQDEEEERAEIDLELEEEKLFNKIKSQSSDTLEDGIEEGVDERVLEAEEKTLIKKAEEEIDNRIIHEEVEKKMEEKGSHHHLAEDWKEPKPVLSRVEDDVKLDTTTEDALYEVFKTLETDGPTEKTFERKNYGAKFRTLLRSRTLKPSSSPTVNLLSTFTLMMFVFCGWFEL